MIAKNREVPLTIRKLEALLRRLPATYPKRPLIEKDLARRNFGFKGEESVDIRLNALPEKKFLIFHDLCLSNGKYNFQMDSLIISKHFALIIEVKNISGTLHFDRSFNQLIRSYNGKEKGFPDPILQVKRHKRELQTLMIGMKLAALPIEYLVVISNPSTIIKLKSGYSREYEKICHSADLENKIKELEKKYQREMISPKEWKKLHRLLLMKQSPHNTNLLQAYSIPREDLLTGVLCPTCSHLPIVRQKGYWLCPICNTKSKNAHVQALLDYFHLISPSITNLEFRDFLHIPSRHIAKRILHSLDLPVKGTKKGRTYLLPK